MLRSACDLFCKFRMAKNCNWAVGSRLSFWRNYAANEKIPSKLKNVCNPTRDMSDTSTISHGFRYSDLIYNALHIEGQALEARANRVNVMDLGIGISFSYMEIKKYFQRMARKVNTPKGIAQAAIAAANGDTELGNFVAKGILEAGIDGFYIISICVVKPSRLRLDRATWRTTMEDFAIFTGGQVVTGESDMNLIPQMLGSCKKVSIGRSWEGMSIFDAAGDEEDIEKRREQLRSAIQLDPSSPYLKERLQRLSPAVRFKVGGATDGKRVYHVLWATKLAMSNGILPGGGVALLNASKLLDKKETSTSDEKLGVQLLQNALKAPIYYIASAAGFDGSVAVEKLLEQDNPNLGYNSAKGEYVDMIDSGNVDVALILTDQIRKAASDYIMKDLGLTKYIGPVYPYPGYDDGSE